MTTPDEIRSLYIETLTRAELSSVSFVDTDGERSTAIRSNVDAAQVAVEALAGAGLLPTQVEEIGAIPVYSDEETIAYWQLGSRRFMTEWQEVHK